MGKQIKPPRWKLQKKKNKLSEEVKILFFKQE